MRRFALLVLVLLGVALFVWPALGGLPSLEHHGAHDRAADPVVERGVELDDALIEVRGADLADTTAIT